MEEAESCKMLLTVLAD